MRINSHKACELNLGIASRLRTRIIRGIQLVFFTTSLGSPQCSCSLPERTIQHVFFRCPRYEVARMSLVRETRSDSLTTMLSSPTSVQAAAHLNSAAAAFQLAADIHTEDTRQYKPLQEP